MRGFAMLNSPFSVGVRPKRFLSARVNMLRREQMMKKLDKRVYEAIADQTILHKK